MSKIKLMSLFFLPLILASFLQSQSLAELAKKEKERRAALKGKTATVITTADLAKVKKRPAVESAAQQQAGEEAVAEGQEEATPPAAAAEEAKAGETAAETPQPVVLVQPPAAMSEKDIQAKQAELMKAVQDKQDMVDLLTLKLNALYQEFNNLDRMQSREFVQGQISQTYEKLLKAESDAKKAAKELDDFVATTKRENSPSIWIK